MSSSSIKGQVWWIQLKKSREKFWTNKIVRKHLYTRLTTTKLERHILFTHNSYKKRAFHCCCLFILHCKRFQRKMLIPQDIEQTQLLLNAHSASSTPIATIYQHYHPMQCGEWDNDDNNDDYNINNWQPDATSPSIVKQILANLGLLLLAAFVHMSIYSWWVCMCVCVSIYVCTTVCLPHPWGRKKNAQCSCGDVFASALAL